MTWHEAVISALRRYTRRHGSLEVDRQTLIREELDQIVADTHSRGKTPDYTLSRELQQLRQRGMLTFIDNDGHYRLARPL